MEPRNREIQVEPTRSKAAEGHGAAAAEVAVGDGTALPSGSESSARQHMPGAREPGGLGGASPPVVGGRQAREGDKPQAVGAHAPKPHASEESDALIVPEKSANSWVTPEESMAGRGAANGKLAQRNAFRAQDRVDALTLLERVGQRATVVKGATHPLPTVRFYSVDRRREPGAGNPHAGFCTGGGPKGPSLP